MPPRVASAPGSIGKNRPVDLTASLSCLRVTPGCTVTVRSSALMLSTWFIWLTSRLMPPSTASRWPSSEVPTPNGITGTRCIAASLTTMATSSVFWAKTTAPGGGTSKGDSSRPCCSRTTIAVEQRAPKCAWSASISAAGTGRWLTVGSKCNGEVGAFMLSVYDGGQFLSFHGVDHGQPPLTNRHPHRG